MLSFNSTTKKKQELRMTGIRLNIGHVQITLLYIYYNSQVMTKVFSLYPLRTMNVSTIRDIKLIVRYRD